MRSSRSGTGPADLFVDDPLAPIRPDVAHRAEAQPDIEPRFSRTACARLAFTSDHWHDHPCRRASATSDCGE